MTYLDELENWARILCKSIWPNHYQFIKISKGTRYGDISINFGKLSKELKIEPKELSSLFKERANKLDKPFPFTVE